MRNLRERAEPALRILCYILAALVVYELASMAARLNPFRGVVVPELPTLTAATNNPPSGPTPVGMNKTNLMATVAGRGTNGALHSLSTNSTSLAAGSSSPGGTNLIVHTEPAAGTNAATNAAINITTNALTNVLVKTETPVGGTNSGSVMISTNGGTNLLLSTTVNGTNAPGSKSKKKNVNAGPMPDMAGMPGMPGMGFNPFGPPGRRGPDLPPAVQARVSKITDSEILGPVMHPLPMALLGIAGNMAFLRSDSGQTGLEKEGDTLDDIKLLRIGINRVLIEQNGQKKELTIFSGYGGDSLLQNDSTNENKHL